MAGAVGALCRWWISRAGYALLGGNFAWGTLIANVIGVVLLVLLFAKLGAMNSRLDALQRGVASAEEKAVLAAKSSLIKVSTYNDPKTRPQTVITILDTDAAAESKLKINKQIVVPLEEK